MPTLTASAPASISALVPSAVATLPAMTRTEFDSFLARVTASSTRCEWPCAVSMTSRSTPASISRSARSKPSSPTLVAAATRRRPCASLVAFGLSCDFSISLTVISPTQLPSASTTSSFSMRCWWSSRLASSWLDALAHRDQVVAGHQLGDLLRRIGGEADVAVGEDADQPAGALAAGAAILDHRNAGNAVRVASAHRASARVASGPMVTGLTTMPRFELLDLADLFGLLGRARLRWMTPMPPAWAMAIARRASVTVSIAADRIGRLRSISPASRVRDVGFGRQRPRNEPAAAARRRR